MARKTIKMDAAQEDWENGSLLKPDERFQTDAEWHGEILEEIQYTLRNSLQEIYGVLDDMKDRLEELNERSKNISVTSPPQQVPPMSTWRFLFSWTVVIIIFLIYYSSR